MSASSRRPATADDSVVGVVPRVVDEPATVQEAAEIVGNAARNRERLLFVGGSTDLDLGAPPEGLDVLLRTARLNQIVEHAPSDQIAVVEAGVTLAALDRALGAAGQRLALDPPLSDRVTVGGAIAANAFGPRRARYGSVRDLIIGITIVRADGVVAHGGGKVVKNVAGFDLPKLTVGSLGSLGLIATATFRLHPLPEESATLLSPGLRAREVVAVVGRIREAQLEPDSVVAFRTAADRFDLAVRFEGFARGVEEQRQRFAAFVAKDLQKPCDALDSAAADRLWARHDATRRSGSFRVKAAALPSALEEVEHEVLGLLSSILEAPACVWYPTLGLGFVGGEPAAASALGEAVSSARRHLASGGGSLVVLSAPQAVRDAADVWGPAPAAVVLIRAVKSRLDPDRRLAPGRLVGGI